MKPSARATLTSLYFSATCTRAITSRESGAGTPLISASAVDSSSDGPQPGMANNNAADRNTKGRANLIGISRGGICLGSVDDDRASERVGQARETTFLRQSD